ncbi:MAG: hypothetical protein KDI82_11430, partial [Gammaproteobacteria bacterium]|nr:hypothetical protein [Gammaproteobacteria bacterium]
MTQKDPQLQFFGDDAVRFVGLSEGLAMTGDYPIAVAAGSNPQRPLWPTADGRVAEGSAYSGSTQL